MTRFRFAQLVVLGATLCKYAAAACLVNTYTTAQIQSVLNAGGAGTIVELCPGSVHVLNSTLNFTAPNQEISTQGYPNTSSGGQAWMVGGGGVRNTLINGVGISGVRVRSVRLGIGSISAISAIAMGGAAQNQVISQVNIQGNAATTAINISPGAGNACSGIRVTNNTVRACGFGIQTDCKAALVQYNQIAFNNRRGISILGGANSQVIDNVINATTSVTNNFGISLVDGTAAGAYSNVLVARNTIRADGSGLLQLGIAVGSRVRSPNGASYLSGPASILNNVFAGNIGFSIVVNGWTNGLTITGNKVAGVRKPSSDSAFATGCTIQQVKNSFNANQQLIAYQPAITGAKTLQSDFASIPQDANNWFCLVDRNRQSIAVNVRIPPSVGNNHVVDLFGFNNGNPHGLQVSLQGSDGNLVGYSHNLDGTTSSVWSTNRFSKNGACTSSACYLIFQGDGNLVQYDAGGVLWASGTAGRGATCTFSNQPPYLYVLDSSGAQIWTVGDLNK